MIHPKYVFASWFRWMPILQSFPWWGLWLLALVGGWVLLIIYASMSWWIWVFLGLATAVFLLNSSIYGLSGPQGD